VVLCDFVTHISMLLAIIKKPSAKLKLFKSTYQKELENLEKKKQELRKETINNQESTLGDLEGIKGAYEMMHGYGIKKFDNLFNICIIGSISSSDMILLTHQIALTNQKLEKLLSARMLAMILIEYLNDINDLLGRKLVNEVTSNGFLDFVPTLREINSEFASIRKKHQTELSTIRNNIAAHKNKNGLSLINQLYKLNPQDILEMTNETIIVNDKLTRETTKIIYRILDDAKEKHDNSQ
jgi:hypothetical protein